MSGRLGPWLIGAALAGAALFAVLMDGGTPARLEGGSPAPPFELRQLDGAPVSSASLRGRVVLINFWATWCKPCEDEMPAMQRLYRALSGDDFELLAISVDESRDDVASFAERLGLSFPILLDPGSEVAHAYQTFRFPESLVVDREGRVVERYVGPKQWDAPAYVARLRRLIAGDAS